MIDVVPHFVHQNTYQLGTGNVDGSEEDQPIAPQPSMGSSTIVQGNALNGLGMGCGQTPQSGKDLIASNGVHQLVLRF